MVAEFPYAVLDACRNDEVFRLVLLEDQPHTFHVILGISPVTERTEIAQVELVLLALFDACNGKCNLPGDECFAASFALMVEEDARAAVHIVCLSVFSHYPEAVLLGNSVWTVRMERRVLVLRNLLYLAIQFGCRGLVDTAGRRHP